MSDSPAADILSEARPLHLSRQALVAINRLLDELLHLCSHAAISPSLAPYEVLTTERFKAGLIRVVGPHLGKNAVLEAELAVRELLRLNPPSMRGDAALRKTIFGSSGLTANIGASQPDDVFRALRSFVQALSVRFLAK